MKRINCTRPRLLVSVGSFNVFSGGSMSVSPGIYDEWVSYVAATCVGVYHLHWMCYIWRNHLDNVIGATNEPYSMFKIFYFHISLWMIVMFSLDAHTLVLLPLCNKLCASLGLVKANRATQAQVHSSAQLPVQFHFSIHASVWEPFLRSPFSPLWDWFPRASESIRGADHFTGWKLMWSVSRWHRWEWIDFVTCVSHTLPTQYADYTLSSWQLHGALCGKYVK